MGSYHGDDSGEHPAIAGQDCFVEVRRHKSRSVSGSVGAGGLEHLHVAAVSQRSRARRRVVLAGFDGSLVSFGREYPDMKRTPNKVGAANAGWASQFRFRGPHHRLGMADLAR